MKIVLPGGSGQMGTVLARAFQSDGHDVVILSRQPGESPGKTAAGKTVIWDAKTLGAWASELDGADVIINLAGHTVNCRYHAQNRKAIKQSRVHSTRIVGAAIAQSSNPPPLWLQASTATIYAHTTGKPHDEFTGAIGGNEPNVPDTWRFSIDVATAWERAIDKITLPHTRKIKMRTAMMMAPARGGVFDVLLGLVRRGLGGYAGNGRQYISWIHDLDLVRAINWLIAHDEVEGAVNIAAPNPLPNAAFMAALRQAWGIRFGLPASRWMLEVGALFMQTETELILKSRRVVPGRLLQAGFPFRFPTWPEAAHDLCRRWRKTTADG